MTVEALRSPPSVDAQRAIDEEISEHEATLAEIVPKISTLRARILELKARRNNYSPISRLPAEILIEIMLEEIRHAQSQSVVVSSRGRFSLAGVCRGWRAIALNTPKLWSSIDVTSTHPDGCLAMLTLSNSAQLHIRYVHQSDDDHILERHGGVAVAILPKIRRIRTFEIDTTFLSYLTRILHANPHASPTSLQVLRLTCRSPEFILHKGVLPPHMPFLRTLVLHCGIAALDLPFLPSLAEFSIFLPSSPVGGGQPISFLLQCLQNTPNLETLLVESLFPAFMEQQLTLAPFAPKLSQLMISSHYVDSVKIFDYLRRPASTVLHFRKPPSTAVAPDLTSLHRTFCRCGLGEVLSVVNARVTLTVNMAIEIALDVSRPSAPLLEHFTLSFPFVDHSHMINSLRIVSTALPLAKAPSLTMTGFWYLGNSLQWPRFFQPFQGVKFLSFDRCDDASLLEGLFKHTDSEYLPLPALQEVRFEDCVVIGPDGVEEHPSLELECWADMREFLSKRKQLGSCIDFYWDGTRFTDLVEETSDSDSLYDEDSDEESSDSNLLYDKESEGSEEE